jgi:two-component system OmpR family sensor kinase
MPPNPLERIAQLEAELAAQRQEMQDFTSAVAHDLRASLRHISSYAQLVQEDAGPQLNDELRGFLDTVVGSAKHLGLMMDALLQLSRVGSQPVRSEAVSLRAALLSAREALSAQAGERAVLWRIEDALPEVQGDPGLVRLALQQVLDNALKFTAGVPQTTIDVSAQRAGPHGGVCLTIADNGVGFNPDLQAALFQPFQRLHPARQFAGLGMGLALTRKAMQRMQGSVGVHATVGQGCTVRLVFATR